MQETLRFDKTLVDIARGDPAAVRRLQRIRRAAVQNIADGALGGGRGTTSFDEIADPVFQERHVIVREGRYDQLADAAIIFVDDVEVRDLRAGTISPGPRSIMRCPVSVEP